MNRYKFYPELNFTVVKFEPGVKLANELLDTARSIRELPEFPQMHYMLSDLRDCNFQFELSETKKMAQLIDDYQHLDNQVLGVYLIDKPLETAYVQYFFKHLKYKRELCSTVEKAYRLFNLPVSIEEFKTLIDI